MTVFAQRVYRQLKTVPMGRVTTYKALAESLNSRAYQAVGQALRHNPDAPNIPCHRVVASNGGLGGFNGQRTGKQLEKKIRLLKSEGVKVVENKIKNFKDVFWRF